MNSIDMITKGANIHREREPVPVCASIRCATIAKQKKRIEKFPRINPKFVYARTTHFSSQLNVFA